jgi:hypothetical protein
VPPARNAEISLDSSQPVNIASALSGPLGGCGGIGKSGTARLKCRAGAVLLNPNEGTDNEAPALERDPAGHAAADAA